MTDLAEHVERICRHLLGEPAEKTAAQWRYGSKGSLAVEIAGDQAGCWYDHEAKAGGGLIELVCREKGFANGEAFDWLHDELGIGDDRRERYRITGTWIYREPASEPLFRVVRRDCEGKPKKIHQERYDPASKSYVGSKGCMTGVRLVPYRLPDWLDVDGPVLIPEGERKCDALFDLSFLATCNPGGAGKFSRGFAPYFQDRDVVVLPDNDDAGQDHVRKVAAILAPVAASVRIVDLPDLPPKGDIIDWLAAGGTGEELRALIDGAALCSPSRNSATPQHPPAPGPVEPPELAETLDILAAFRRDVALRGLVGENATAQLLYLAVTSRLLAKPVSVSVKGHSSSGKSHTLDRVIEFFPDEAIIKFTGMSERALVYRDDDYQHRTLVIYEVTGLQEAKEDNLAAYFVRSLLSEGRLEYDVTIRDAGGQYTTQRIVKEGPTNLVFTTTRTKVHAENETRVLSLNTDDSTEQTQRVLAALVKEDEHSVDLAEWRQLQAWLQTTEHRVTIPYGDALAESVPPLAIRLRRDFGAVLALIRAHAILHQQTRARDDAGRIVATIKDYAAVRGLVADVISEGVGAGVSDVVRETVEAVKAISAGGASASVGDIASKLGLDKSNASRRVRRAADGGYIRNLEDKRGRPARWVIGDPMPDSVELLPDPKKLSAAAQHATARNAESGGIPVCCGVAPVREGIHTQDDFASTCDHCGDPIDLDAGYTATSGGEHLHNRCVDSWLQR